LQRNWTSCTANNFAARFLPLNCWLFRVYCKEAFTTETQSSQSSEYFLLKHALLRASAVQSPSPASQGSLKRRIVKQNEFKNIYRTKSPSSQRKILVISTPSSSSGVNSGRNPRSVLRRSRSILDPSHSLGMTGLGPSPWRLCVFARVTMFPILLSEIPPKISNTFR
jgi:hypothetical protein